MDRKSKILIVGFFVLVIASASSCYVRYMSLKDFTVFVNEEEIPEPLSVTGVLDKFSE